MFYPLRVEKVWVEVLDISSSFLLHCVSLLLPKLNLINIFQLWTQNHWITLVETIRKLLGVLFSQPLRFHSNSLSCVAQDRVTPLACLSFLSACFPLWAIPLPFSNSGFQFKPLWIFLLVVFDLKLSRVLVIGSMQNKWPLNPVYPYYLCRRCHRATTPHFKIYNFYNSHNGHLILPFS